MTNAEERAWEAYPDYPSMDGGYITQRKTRSIFINGYHQAIADACEYLQNNIDKDLTIYHEQCWWKRDEFITKLKQSMVNTTENAKEQLKKIKEL